MYFFSIPICIDQKTYRLDTRKYIFMLEMSETRQLVGANVWFCYRNISVFEMQRNGRMTMVRI